MKWPYRYSPSESNCGSALENLDPNGQQTVGNVPCMLRDGGKSSCRPRQRAGFTPEPSERAPACTPPAGRRHAPSRCVRARVRLGRQSVCSLKHAAASEAARLGGVGAVCTRSALCSLGSSWLLAAAFTAARNCECSEITELRAKLSPIRSELVELRNQVIRIRSLQSTRFLSWHGRMAVDA